MPKSLRSHLQPFLAGTADDCALPAEEAAQPASLILQALAGELRLGTGH